MLDKMMKKLEYLWAQYFSFFVIGSYWFLGLCNNFAYVIMLSAAHDILNEESSNNSTTNTSGTTTVSPFHPNKTNKYDCNDLSTGTILLADIIPGILIKMIAPFFVHRIKYWQRVLMVILVNASSYLLVALAKSKILIFLGVVCASLSSSFGEITFLSLSTFYTRSLSLTGWGSGTGAAGLFGSLGYAGITSAGVSPRNTILMMLFIPGLMGISYITLPSIKFTKTRNYKDIDETDQSATDESSAESTDGGEEAIIRREGSSSNLSSNNRFSLNDFIQKIVALRVLLKYMIPLFLVYYAEYFINQGLFELLYFKGAFLSHKEQYRWYNVAYQLAVFISRTSIYFIKIKFLPIFPILQVLNVVICLVQIFYGFIPSIWIMFLIILWEGLLGGGCYVNAFNMVSIEIPKKDREFSIAITSIADSFGITLAGFTSIPVHNAICNYGNK